MEREKDRNSVSDEKETGRVEAFSDGVFAIAVTLLILEIKVPPLPATADGATLWKALLASWPSLVAFLTSFGAILTMWINHHGFFRLLRGVHSRFLFANGLLLLMVTFVNFPTALVARFLTTPAANVAAAAYCGTYILLNLSFNALYFAAASGPEPLFKSSVTAAHRRRVRNAYLLTGPVYLAATLLSLVSAAAGLALCNALWIFWAALDYAAPRPHGTASPAPAEDRRGA